MLHGGDHRCLLRRESGDHGEVHGPVCVKAVQSVQVAAEAFGTVDVGQLIFQGQPRKLFLQRFYGGLRWHVSSVQGHGKIVQVQEIAA